jgi:hypothetical protein
LLQNFWHRLTRFSVRIRLNTGFHRIAAALKKGETRISAIIKEGSLADAQWYSFGVNKTHGLRRTNEDKRRAVKATLEHELSDDWSDGKISDHCGVTQRMVGEVRKSCVSPLKNSGVTKRVGRDGKVYDAEKASAASKKRAAKTTTSKTTTTVKVEEDLPEEAFVEEHEEPKTAYVLEEETKATAALLIYLLPGT